MSKSIKQIGCAVIYQENKLLLVKRTSGDFKDLYEFPGGKRKLGESITRCVRREVWEELNCECSTHELIYYYKIPDPKYSHLHLYFYRVNLLTFDIKLSREHTQYKWVTLDEAKKMDLIKWDYKLLDYLDEYFLKQLT